MTNTSVRESGCDLKNQRRRIDFARVGVGVDRCAAHTSPKRRLFGLPRWAYPSAKWAVLPPEIVIRLERPKCSGVVSDVSLTCPPKNRPSYSANKIARSSGWILVEFGA